MSADCPLSADAVAVVRQRSLNRKSRPDEKSAASSSQLPEHPSKSQDGGKHGSRSVRAWIIVSLVSFVVVVVTLLRPWAWAFQWKGFGIATSKLESLDRILRPKTHVHRPITKLFTNGTYQKDTERQTESRNASISSTTI